MIFWYCLKRVVIILFYNILVMWKPVISVIMPSYKSKEKWLTESIESVLAQSYKNIELIIICDEPSKEVETLIQKYVKEDNRVKYVKNSKKFNIWKALNQWIFLSQGKYIARIDDDDIRDDTDKLKKQVEFMDNNPEYGVCWVSLMKCINEKWEVFNTIVYKSDDKDIKNTILQTCPLAHPSVLIRKSAFAKCWIYDPSCITEDYDLWCRIGRFYKICNVDSWIKYRIHEKSLSNSKNKRTVIKKASFKVFWKYKMYYPNKIKGFITRTYFLLMPEKGIEIIHKLLIHIRKQ